MKIELARSKILKRSKDSMKCSQVKYVNCDESHPQINKYTHTHTLTWDAQVCAEGRRWWREMYIMDGAQPTGAIHNSTHFVIALVAALGEVVNESWPPGAHREGGSYS